MSRIERAAHDRDYTVIANAALRDGRLSWKARGMLAYLLSKPDDWTVVQAELETAGPEGRAAVRAGLAELERAGYLTRDRVTRRIDGRMVTVLSTSLWETGLWTTGHRGAETGLYEVPPLEKKFRGWRKSPPGGDRPIMVVVADGAPEPILAIPPPEHLRGAGAVGRARRRAQDEPGEAAQ